MRVTFTAQFDTVAPAFMWGFHPDVGVITASLYWFHFRIDW